MPAHASHILQPLDLSYFGPLKQAYSSILMDLSHLPRISNIDFLKAFKQAHARALTADNIRNGFKGTGLFPFDPSTVLSKLHRIPTPPAQDPASWESQTPHNMRQLEAQHKFTRVQIVENPCQAIQSLDQLVKRAQGFVHNLVLACDQVTAQQSQQQGQRRRRRYIKKRGYLSVLQACQLASQPLQLGQPASLPPSQPASQPASQPLNQLSSQPPNQLLSQPASQPASQRLSPPSNPRPSKPASQPACQFAPQPPSQPPSQPARQLASQLPSQPACQLPGQPFSQPAMLPACQFARQPAS